MARRPLQEINAGSMADIAFLLLIFFLVTTTFDQDMGILRQLPPPVPEDQPPPPKVKERDVYEVLVNANNQLLVENEPMDISRLKEGAIEFYTNPSNSPDLPQLEWVTRAKAMEKIEEARNILSQDKNNQEAKKQLKNWQDKLNAVEMIGEFRALPSSALISLRNDRGTSYETYIAVQNELQAAVDQLRNDLARDEFGVRYDELKPNIDEDKPKILAIREAVPMRISEAEPKDVGGSN